MKYGNDIRYITERAVFKLNADGIMLEEIAPGSDLEKDVLSKMNFKPRVGIVKEMDSRLFRDDKMGIKEEFFQKIKK
jgi:acyl CoA:acetate/3-ketoacid CoA transferase